MKLEDGRGLPLWAFPAEHFKRPAEAFRLQAVTAGATDCAQAVLWSGLPFGTLTARVLHFKPGGKCSCLQRARPGVGGTQVP